VKRSIVFSTPVVAKGIQADFHPAASPEIFRFAIWLKAKPAALYPSLSFSCLTARLSLNLSYFSSIINQVLQAEGMPAAAQQRWRDSYGTEEDSHAGW
jgi:hypothetical protein